MYLINSTKTMYAMLYLANFVVFCKYLLFLFFRFDASNMFQTS